MKKTGILALLLVALVAFTGLAFDMADYGTTRTITNSAASATMGDVLIVYDSAVTNTITFDVILTQGTNSVTYRIGSSSVTSNQYDSARDLIPVVLKPGEMWLISTTDTNVNLHISGI